MKITYYSLLVIHVLLVFGVGLWLLSMGRNEIKKIPKGFLSLTLLTMVLSLAMMQINLMHHNQDASVDLLSPYKYLLKTAVFAILIGVVIKNYKKASISQRAWLFMIALMGFDLIITGVWIQ
jgi:hypothetical protein